MKDIIIRKPFKTGIVKEGSIPEFIGTDGIEWYDEQNIIWGNDRS